MYHLLREVGDFMPLSNYALTTLNSAKGVLGVKLDDLTKDNYVTDLINGASTAIEDNCNRKLKARDFTDELYSGKNSRVLMLRNYPVNSITAIVTLDSEDAETAVVVTRKNVDAGILYYPSGVWPEGDVNIKVTYNAGYSTIPENLALACNLLVEFYYKLTIADFSTTFGEDGVVMKPEAWPGKVKKLLEPFRKVR
jgi:hypothetical protein